MEISCSRAELSEGLRIVAGVVDPRNIKPILKDIHLRTTDDGLEITATDLEVGIRYLIRDVEVKAKGDIVVSAELMNGIVGQSFEERLTLKAKDAHLVVEGKGSRFQLVGLSGEEFPEIPDMPEKDCLEMEGAVLKEMIAKTIFAVAVEKQRYALNGVLLVTKERSAKIEMVATDGHRMALIKRKANSPAPFTASAIIPAKALQQIEKMVGAEDIVKISVQERQVLLRAENGLIVAQLVEGRFPEYKEVIPDDCDKKMEVSADEFRNAVRQAAVVSARGSKAICMKLTKNSLIVESSDPESGEGHVEVPVKYEGENLEIRFNPDFVLDGIKALGEENLRMEMKDSTRAALMKDGADYLYLVMPITQE